MMPNPCNGPSVRAFRTSISNVPWSRSAFGLLTIILPSERGGVGSAKPRISRLGDYISSSLECQGFIDFRITGLFEGAIEKWRDPEGSPKKKGSEVRSS